MWPSVALAAALMGAAAGAAPPNIVVLFVDDFGWGDVGANVPGSPSETPNIDALAARGMRFTDFHAMPLCTPSRAQLLTGRLAPRHGVWKNFQEDSLGGLNTSEITLAEFLKARGYATAMRGKWHLGHNAPHHPSFRGFDETTVVPYSVDMGCVDNSTWYVPGTGANVPVAHDCLSGDPGVIMPALPLYNATTNCSGGACNAAIARQPLDLSELSDTYNAEARRFISASAAAGTPFFLYMPFSHTHVPLMTASRWVNASTAQDPFHDVVREVDNSVGEVLAALEAAGVADSTYVFATADNGPWEAKCGLAGSAGPFVGAYQRVLTPGSASLKDTTWEGGHRVFGVVAGPGVPRGGVTHALASTLDIWPTVASLVGAPLPGDRTYDGVDLSPVLLRGAAGVREVLFIPDTSGATPGGLTAARFRNFSVYYQTNGESNCGKPFSPLPVAVHDPPLVFDLEADPGQTTPLSPPPADVLAAVAAARAAVEADIASTFRTTIDWSGGGRAAWACCNPAEPDCGCRSAAASGGAAAVAVAAA